MLTFLRSSVAMWARRRGAGVDPAILIGSYPTTVGATGQMSFRPDGRRGTFVAFALSRPTSTSEDTVPFSKVALNVEGRRITYTPVPRGALIYDGGGGPTTGGMINVSQWPAPFLIEGKASLTLTESCTGAGDLQGIVYLLAGFYTDPKTAAEIVARWGQLRAFCLDVEPDISVANGNVQMPYTVPDDDERVWLQEFAAKNFQTVDVGVLDFVRLTVQSWELLTTTSSAASGLILPGRLGIPTAYIGRWVRPGDNVNLTEKISTLTRRDLWAFLAVAGGDPVTVESDGLIVDGALLQ